MFFDKFWINLSLKSLRIVALRKKETKAHQEHCPWPRNYLSVHLLRKSQREKGHIIPQGAADGGFRLGRPRASSQGQQKHIVRCPPGNAFSIRIKEPQAQRQGNDAVQTFLFSLVNGNNIYFAMDKQAH